MVTATSAKQKRWRLRLMAMLFGLAVALVVGEIAVLLSGVNNHYRVPATSQIIPRSGGPFDLAPNGFVPFSTLRTTYPSNPRGYFDHNSGIDHKFNSRGWRDDEHTVEKPDNTLRILALGDSYLFGQGVKRKDLFIEQLPRLLASKLETHQEIETINTGQSAYNTEMELKLLRESGLAYQPDAVLLSFVPNDVEPNIFAEGHKVEFFSEFTNSYVTNDWLSRYSELWMFLRRSLAYYTLGQRHLQNSIDSYLDDSEKWQKCRSALLDMRNLCEEYDVPLLVVIFPFFVNLNGDYPFQPIHDQVVSTCEDKGIAVLDLRESYRNYRGPELWVHPTDQHPNDVAHQIAAEAIAEKLSALDPFKN